MKWIIFVLMVLASACREVPTSEKLEEQQIIFGLDSLVQETCHGETCARLRLIWPVAKGDSSAVKINEAIQSQLLGFLQVGEDPWTSLDSAANDFLRSFEEFKKEFPESGGSWEIEVKGNLSYESDRTVSIFFEQYNYTGGAHPNSSVVFLNFEKKSGEYLSTDRLLLDQAKVAMLAEQKFRYYHQVEDGVSLEEDGRFFLPETGFFLANAMGFKEGKFWIIYVPYEIGPYVLGYTELEFTKEELGDAVTW
jgi:hypothetical protein